jgi:hypothetical protein
MDGTPRAKDEQNELGVDQCPEKQEVDLCLSRVGIRQEVELNGRSGVSV